MHYSLSRAVTDKDDYVRVWASYGSRSGESHNVNRATYFSGGGYRPGVKKIYSEWLGGRSRSSARYQQWRSYRANWDRMWRAYIAWTPTRGEDYRLGRRTEGDSPPYAATGSSGHAYVPQIHVFGDTTVEPDEHIWWRITKVEGAEMPTGGAVFGKVIIQTDDSNPPPAPVECGQGQTENCVDPEDLPWRVTAENVGLSRPTDSIIVGLPVTFTLRT